MVSLLPRLRRESANAVPAERTLPVAQGRNGALGEIDPLPSERSLAAMERVFEVLAMEHDKPDKPDLPWFTVRHDATGTPRPAQRRS